MVKKHIEERKRAWNNEQKIVYSYSEQNQRMAFMRCFFQIWGFDRFDIKIEIPVFSRSVDLVIFDKSTQELIAVEFKLLNWKKVIEQVVRIEHSFDYSFICVMEPKTLRTKEEIIINCKEKGIGLIFSRYIDSRFKFSYEVEPQKKYEVWAYNRQKVLSLWARKIFGWYKISKN